MQIATSEESASLKSLPPREWAVIAIIASALVTLTVITQPVSDQLLSIEEGDVPSIPLITVTVIGAVAKPGIYEVERGTTFKKVIEMAVPAEDADLDKIDLAATVKRRKTFNVRKRDTSKRLRKPRNKKEQK